MCHYNIFHYLLDTTKCLFKYYPCYICLANILFAVNIEPTNQPTNQIYCFVMHIYEYPLLFCDVLGTTTKKCGNRARV